MSDGVAHTGLIIMLGTFPPPVHGMAVINASMLAKLRERRSQPVVLNTAAEGLARSALARLGRVPRVCEAAWRLIVVKKGSHASLYMSVSGGIGQVYEVVLAAIARLRGMRIFLHHHSYAYIDKRRLVAQWLARTAGTNAVHVVLSNDMGRRLAAQYPSVTGVVRLSNAAFLPEPETNAAPARTSLRTIGFLGNISHEKGVFDFLDLCALIRSEGLPLRARLAGPFKDDETKRLVMQRLAELPDVEYVGPKYNQEKNAFYSEIDALVFPTRYVNEAEPVTIHEAMQAGLPVISYSRGAIAEVVSLDAGVIIPANAPFAIDAFAALSRWYAEDSVYQDVSRASRERFEALRLNANRVLTGFIGELLKTV